eukprot:scaffold27186_cov70-Attheya_sp.AAC.1
MSQSFFVPWYHRPHEYYLSIPWVSWFAPKLFHDTAAVHWQEGTVDIPPLPFSVPGPLAIFGRRHVPILPTAGQPCLDWLVAVVSRNHVHLSILIWDR